MENVFRRNCPALSIRRKVSKYLEKCGAGTDDAQGRRVDQRDGREASIADLISTRAVAGTCMFCECLNFSLSGSYCLTDGKAVLQEMSSPLDTKKSVQVAGKMWCRYGVRTLPQAAGGGDARDYRELEGR